MHHYRGLLKEGSEARLEPANVYIEYLGPQDGNRPNWNGYLLVPDESTVRPEILYTLELEDGRAGDLAIDHVEPDGSGRFRAVFIGESPLK